jgi:hypothetical protein
LNEPGNPTFTMKQELTAGRTPSPQVHPLFIAAFYYLFMPPAYPASQNLILLVMS